jgi:hypothetical protein
MQTDFKDQVRALMSSGMGDDAIARRLGVTRHSVRKAQRELLLDTEPEGGSRTSGLSTNHDTSSGSMTISGIVHASDNVHSLEALLEDARVDMRIYQVSKWTANYWGKPGDYNWQVKAELRPRDPQSIGLEHLIEELKQQSPEREYKYHPKVIENSRRALEISMMDVHYGMRCFSPAACEDYSPEMAETLVWRTVDLMLERALSFGPFEKIVLPFGNDWMHHDNVFHTTTAGTGQPEAESWHHTFVQAKYLIWDLIEALSDHAPVEVVVIPGNHDRQTAFALGQVVEARFWNDENITVYADPAPYKFWRYGINLTGFEHGHSIKPKDLPGIVINECRGILPEVRSIQWHCGDQHREAPRFGDHGIVTKYLPSFVAGNEWHKLKGFSWAHRASIGFVYDYHGGIICQPQVNANEIYS